MNYELSGVFLDFPFRRNQQLKSDENWDVRILKTNIQDVLDETKQDRQCTCNVTLRRAHWTIVALQK